MYWHVHTHTHTHTHTHDTHIHACTHACTHTHTHTHTHAHTRTHACTHTHTHSLGTFGDLLVTYSVQSTDAATLALASGRPLLDFYTTPTSNTALSSQSQLQALQGSLSSCATSCLGNEGCRSFSISGNDCRLYFTSSSLGAETVVAIGTDYYEKIEELVSRLYTAIKDDFKTLSFLSL